MAEFPVQPDQVDAAWLDATLHAAGVLGDGQEVTAVRAEPVGSGVGLLGIVMRLHVDIAGAGPDTPPSFVAKFAHPSEVNRAIGMATRMYEREVAFFADIAPHVDMPLPLCHFAAVEPTTGENIVLLEDLGAYRAGDQGAGTDAESARSILEAVAPLHAAWFGNCDRPVLDGHMRVDTSWVDGFAPGLVANWERGVELYGDDIEPSVLDQVERYVAAVPEIQRRLGSGTQTLVHGDVRLDNVMFGTDPSHHPVMLVDWQAVMVSAPAQDVAYLLSQSLPVEERRAHETDLVEHYHRRMVDLGADYPLEQCWTDYEHGVLFSFAYALIIAGITDLENPDAITLSREVLRRNSALIADRDLFRLLP